MPHVPAEFPDDDPWMAAMRGGDLAAAWTISDEVLQRHRMSGEQNWDRPRHLQHIWTGEPLAGRRVLVRCYHGLGDTIQFVRFIRPLRALARHVVVWAQPALLELVASAAGVDEVLALHDGIPDADYDVDVEIMELPHALRVTAIPSGVPYLYPPCAVRDCNEDRSFTVGVVWEAGSWDLRRSLPLSLMRRIGDLPGIRLISLQVGTAAAQAPSIPAATTDCSTLNQTAARILELDLVISVDTMVAHLAGALGRPVWTLLHADCDWRWGTGRSDCVWYPTMRLFRQARANDWATVVEELRVALLHQSATGSATAADGKEQTLPLRRSAVGDEKQAVG